MIFVAKTKCPKPNFLARLRKASKRSYSCLVSCPRLVMILLTDDYLFVSKCTRVIYGQTDGQTEFRSKKPFVHTLHVSSRTVKRKVGWIHTKK